MRKIFRELVSIEEAISRLYHHYKPKREVEVVDLLNAFGRVVAEDIYSKVDIPPFDRATMDGYAVRAEDTFEAEEDNPVVLKVIGYIEAGSNTDLEIKNGEAIEISTGAPIPKGANAVVMVEYTSRDNNDVFIYKPVTPGENIMGAGSDIMAGEMIVRKDTVLTQREIGVLSAAGFEEVKVYEKPKVAVISTGNELVTPGNKLDYGKIYDVNSYAICSAIKENGGKAIFLGIARDEEEEIRTKIIEGLKIAEIVICSGGTSAGMGDLMHRILNSVGKPGLIVHGVSVKPGKPTIIAVCDNKPVFGLPGYPTSALMIFEIFVAPLLRKIAGINVERRKVKAKLPLKVFSIVGRKEFLPVNVVEGVEGYTAYPVSGHYSGAITALSETDGFIEIPEYKAFLDSGEEVEVKLFSDELKLADLMIIGSHCIGIDVSLEVLRRRKPIFAKVINVGSSGGLMAVKRGEADIAGTHLLDESGVYNIPFLKKYGLIDKVYLVKGYIREQGFIIKKGNPKKIKGFEDLLRKDIALINRNPGSGTRILLDMELKGLAEKKGVEFEELKRKINGYNIEAKSHTAVAVAVLMGKADVGLGIKTVAVRYGLDFIPIRGEEYDFVIRKDRIEKEAVKLFLDVLKSKEFKRELEKVEGLIVTDKSGEIVNIM
ncbi:molybdopterin biosynthesis protein [Archaeoglobales archaeon]|nr:MAG: molybdopterin biosynthesis protein [Archaeoglobales archaeon]